MEKETWTCSGCKYEDNEISREICKICGRYKPSAPGDWECIYCETENKKTEEKCGLCKNDKKCGSKSKYMILQREYGWPDVPEKIQMIDVYDTLEEAEKNMPNDYSYSRFPFSQYPNNEEIDVQFRLYQQQEKTPLGW